MCISLSLSPVVHRLPTDCHILSSHSHCNHVLRSSPYQFCGLRFRFTASSLGASLLQLHLRVYWLRLSHALRSPQTLRYRRTEARRPEVRALADESADKPKLPRNCCPSTALPDFYSGRISACGPCASCS